ncbi:MAG: bifunctional transaldolase/phosoglucose isomerase [Planctomycetes bacterium]|nr:bifunctional transaldolase/phosoglucose isomerase [Planctomycetota bacterium]
MDARAAQLARLGQSIWYDNVSRDLLDSGDLARLVADGGVRGVTSNPTIFQKAMSSSKAYQAQFEALAARGGTAESIYEACAVEDIRRGADLLRGVYDASGGTDGFISLEVSPRLAADTAATVAEAKRLHAAVGRPNLMIKVPATPEGIPAIRALIASGMCINVTLIFSLAAHGQVIEAYIAGLEDRVKAGGVIAGIASVASFFISRVDTSVDAALDAKAKAEPARAAEILALRGQAAIANAKMAYALFEERFSGPRWQALAAKGAQVQRPLWASTSTKNPNYKDTIYVDALVGPHTVNTVPPATLVALNDHGTVASSIQQGMSDARATLAALETFGISMETVCADLLKAGVSSFAQSFDDLVGAVEKRRSAAAAASAGPFHGERVEQLRRGAVEALLARGTLRRIWARDASLFSANAAARTSVSNRLGWLTAHELMAGRVPELTAFAADARADGFTDVILCGMGGSSLCAEVLRDVVGPQPRGLRLQVLDSTDPEAIRLVESRTDLAKTLIVVASKSGGTVETDCMMRHFWARHEARGERSPGRFFVAITDPGSSLVTEAETRHFRAVFENPADIGGRYSATSLFGLVPAALLGLDLDRFLASTAGAAGRNGPDADPDDAAGFQLGALIGALANAGADKLSLRASPRLVAFGAWAEQLIAESTGKEGKGVLPVVEEPAGTFHGGDRVHVDLQLVGDAAPPAGPRPEAIIVLGAPEELGGLFFQFEMATAVAGVALGVNPFDEPNVAEAKAATNAVLAGTGAAPQLAVGKAPLFEMRMPPTVGGKCPQELFAEMAAGDYVAVLAYVARTDARHALLQQLRANVSRSAKAATTLGYGPRYLHSTGQLHKGGGDSGVFLLITQDEHPAQDLPIAGKPYTFGRLFAAQAEGDLRTLVARGRRVFELRLKGNVDEALAALRDAF